MVKRTVDPERANIRRMKKIMREVNRRFPVTPDLRKNIRQRAGMIKRLMRKHGIAPETTLGRRWNDPQKVVFPPPIIPAADGELRAPQPQETVNHPQHYGGDTTYEVIKVLKAWGLRDFNLGNTVKYIARAGKKGPALEDLKKALWYLRDKVEELEKVTAHVVEAEPVKHITVNNLAPINVLGRRTLKKKRPRRYRPLMQPWPMPRRNRRVSRRKK